MSDEYLKEPVKAPKLNIPASSATVDVRIIDSTSNLDMAVNLFYPQQIKGHDSLNGPAYSFLITHQKEHYLFDLGVRKDPSTLPPELYERLSKMINITVEKNVADILQDDQEVGIKPKDISGIFWSHHHFDHIGDISTFPGTPLIVGPGLQAKYLPGYPENPHAPLNQSDFENRPVREVDIENEGNGLKIGNASAMDFFGDGSLYLLNTPGHSVGHMCALARVTADPPSFVLMGGDACHHAAEFRPTQYLPLPKEVRPSPIPRKYPNACPGELLEKFKETDGVDSPFYVIRDNFCDDKTAALDSVHRIEEFDASDEVIVAIAHDPSLKNSIPFFPKSLKDWRAQDLKKKTQWLFVQDFKQALEEVA